MLHNCAALTHIGKTRHINQDCYRYSQADGFWIIADGMGGHQGGEVASKLACDEIYAMMTTAADATGSIQKTHQLIQSSASNNPQYNTMGTTVVLAEVNNNHYRIHWVGDSRAYLLSSNRITQLSHDHSLVQQWVDEGVISPEEATVHPKRNVITQCLGSPLIAQLNIGQVSGVLHPDEKLLLCSDGLTNELPDNHILEIINSVNDSTIAVQQLIDAANYHGGRDNITVIIIDALINTDKGPPYPNG